MERPITVGDRVSVKEPFKQFMPGVYAVVLVKSDEDGTCVIDVDGEHKDFAPVHLERVA
jgi:hypothetical protein